MNGSQYLFPGVRGGKFCLKSFDRQCKILLTDVLGKEENSKNIFGTHIWRKTAYSLALVGKYGLKIYILLYTYSLSNVFFSLFLGFFGINNISHFISKGSLETVEKCISLIMVSARHSTFKDAKLYIQDIAHRLARAQNLGISGNEVGKWTPIHICYDSACNQPGFLKTRHLLGTILEVCNRYVTVNMNIDDIHKYTYKELLEKAEENWLAVNKPMVYFDQNSSIGKDSTTLLCQRCQSVPLIGGSIDDSTTNNIPPTVQVLTNVTNTTTKSDNFY